MDVQAKYGPLLSQIYEIGSILTLHRRYIRQFFSQVDLGITDDTRILDVGCGGGRFHASCLRSLRIKNRDKGIKDLKTVIDAFDISEYMLKIAERRAKRRQFRDNVRLYKADSCNLFFAQEFIDGRVSENAVILPSNHYDIVFCPGVLECIPRDKAEDAIAEIMRVLKPDGALVFLYVQNNKLGRRATQILRFKLIDKEAVFNKFYEHGLQDLEEFHVRSHHPYLKTLTGIYIGRKQPDSGLEAEVQQSLNKKEESIRI